MSLCKTEGIARFRGAQNEGTSLYKHDNQNHDQALLTTSNKGCLGNVDKYGQDQAENIKESLIDS